MTDDDPALGEQILNVAEAEVEPKVQPDSVRDDLGRETVASMDCTITGSICSDGHQATLIVDPRST